MIAGVWKADSLTGHCPTDHSLSGVSKGPYDHFRLTLKIVNVTLMEAIPLWANIEVYIYIYTGCFTT